MHDTAGRGNNTDVLPQIALEHINVHLAGRHVLRDISWSLTAGQHWAIAGPNGSGKSTFLRVIAGRQWIDADDGARTYSPDGMRTDVVARAATWIRVVSAEQHERYGRLGLAISGRSVIESGFEDTVYVHHTASAHQARRVDALLDEFGLRALAQRHLRELSSGQIRRLLIARAIVAEPRVLVLDECTNGLDRAARQGVLEMLDRLAPSVALVVASHRSADFPAAITHTAFISDGRISRTSLGGPPRQPWVAELSRSTPAPGRHSPVILRIAHADVYRGRTLVLKNVNWQLCRGEHTLIRGANGAGKTTFAGLLAGTISAATGSYIERFGQTGPFDIWKLKEQIAHLSDDLQIAYDVGDTVESVVASGFRSSIGLIFEPTAAQREITAAILMRIGLEPFRNRTFTALSFGERRKVLIARSLVRRPAIFVLDEIWSGLDAGFRQALHRLLADMVNAGTTIVAVAHDDDDDIVSLATRICVVENGTIREANAGAL